MGNFIFYPRVTETDSENNEKENRSGFLEIPCEFGEVSDGFHTFGELYEHRNLLFCGMTHAAMRMFFPDALYCWKSKTHWIDGGLEPVRDGWFIAGIELQCGPDPKMITYHLPLEYWDLFDGIEREQAPPHDGHTSQDVIERLREWLKK